MTVRCWARFDDLRAGTAMCFGQPDRVLAADRAAEVPDVLDEVDRATAAGAWAFGFVAYEAAPGLDRHLTTGPPVDGLPLAWFGICAEPTTVPAIQARPPRRYTAGPWRVAWTSDQHREAVTAVRERIAAGDTYQVNVTTRMAAPVCGDLTGFYADLALAQRGSYNAFLDLGRFVIAGASPELFFEMNNGRLVTRPMKGTAARGQSQAQDAALANALRDSAKDRAENVMIVDLMRNDLAAIAATGTVVVTALCRLETYQTVHQLVSEIGAQLRPGVGLTEVFRALFPSGSVTGAPKIATMRVIAALEPAPRGVYCGAVGVVGPAQARFNVAIRTVVVDRSTGTAVYGTGGGITWASDPASEYAELLTKAHLLPAHVPRSRA
ncbi:MAG: aminodeoxychorismate synthase component I [Mycobacteriaceae bacterium]|nr:aminodeoxychorismate synthase component I [Mycobacteriaceae bacterium]